MKRFLLPCAAMALLACKHRGHGPGGPVGGHVALHNDSDRTLYALGLLMGQRLEDFNLTPAELAVVEQGITDKTTHATPQVDIAQWGPRISVMARERQGVRAQAEHARGAAYLTTAAAEAGAQRLPSGVIYRELRAGTGAQPAASDRVRVNYRGTLINGTEFDSSYTRHEPAEFALNGVIPCWTQGVGMMHVGGQARLVCPPDQAYGDRGQRDIPPGSTLIFEVELLAIVTPDAGAPAAAPMIGPGGAMPGAGAGGFPRMMMPH